jgi:ATP-dependent helicase/nuclease subunit B
LGRIADAHQEVLSASGLDLAATDRDDGKKLAEAFARFSGNFAPDLSVEEYADALGALLAGQTVYPPADPRARIRILGPLEARLLTFDRILIGGMNEGTWPAETHNDSWLNRPMRKALGLDLPERWVSLRAHDFAQAAGARELVLSRARRQNGVETVASRFLQRIKAVAPMPAWKAAVARGDEYLALAQALERPAPLKRIERPAPRPPLAARPAHLSVTDIEALVRDPYTIYARHVLKLLPLDPLDAEPGAAERGTLLHAALAEFAKAFPRDLPADAGEQLLRYGRQVFAKYAIFPGVAAVWWPRFERIAHWFAGEEAARRGDLKEIFIEQRGKLRLEIGGRPFTLSAQADRIERREDGAVVIVDYKTGEAPTFLQAINGLAPQLPLEAAIARGGGFAPVGENASVAGLEIMRLSGGTPAGEIVSFDPAKAERDAKKLAERFHLVDCDGFAAFTRARLEALLAKFSEASTPYHSVPRPKWKGRFGPYDHLARIKEWSASGGSEEA